MNITTKIIINVYISDLIKFDEINSNTGNLNIISRFKLISATED